MAIKYTGDVARFTSSDLKQENSASQQERRKKRKKLKHLLRHSKILAKVRRTKCTVVQNCR